MNEEKKTRQSGNFPSLFWAVPLILSALLAYYNWPLGLLGFLFSGYAAVRLRALSERVEEERIRSIESLHEDFDDVTRQAIFTMPFPMAILDHRGKIKWYNTKFKQLSGKEDLLGLSAQEFTKIDPKSLLRKEAPEILEIDFEHKHYQFYYQPVEHMKGGEESLILYGVDNTADHMLAKAYRDRGLAILLMEVDNYDELMATTEETVRPVVLAAIDRLVNEYGKRYGALVRKYDQESYLVIVEYKNLEEMVRGKLSILDDVREMNRGNTIPATLSIGVGVLGSNPLDTYRKASVALDVALGRGGDQGVLKEGDSLSFFGGKNKATEKRNKVKSRVIAHALAQLIDQASEVFIMGHKNSDMDAFGACLGVYEAVKKRGKEGYIVLNDVNPSIKNIFDAVMEYDPSYEQIILRKEYAFDRCKETSLLVVVDTHRAVSTEGPDLFKRTDKVVVLDHHRLGADYITDPTLSYLEPYASSTCELVTEVLFYMFDKLELPKVIANALLAGITVDTKNFYYQTGVRTFEAASILKRQGADSIAVKQLFKDDFNTIKQKAEVIAHSKVYHDNVSIGVFPYALEESMLIAAQAADDLLSILGIEASFVLTLVGGRVHISGRSLGAISVQLILEKIGGGGHLTAAGTQLDGTIDDAITTLKWAIDRYFEEEQEDENDTH